MLGLVPGSAVGPPRLPVPCSICRTNPFAFSCLLPPVVAPWAVEVDWVLPNSYNRAGLSLVVAFAFAFAHTRCCTELCAWTSRPWAYLPGILQEEHGSFRIPDGSEMQDDRQRPTKGFRWIPGVAVVGTDLEKGDRKLVPAPAPLLEDGTQGFRWIPGAAAVGTNLGLRQ